MRAHRHIQASEPAVKLYAQMQELKLLRELVKEAEHSKPSRTPRKAARNSPQYLFSCPAASDYDPAGDDHERHARAVGETSS
jgi:hypothetical protein